MDLRETLAAWQGYSKRGSPPACFGTFTLHHPSLCQPSFRKLVAPFVNPRLSLLNALVVVPLLVLSGCGTPTEQSQGTSAARSSVTNTATSTVTNTVTDAAWAPKLVDLKAARHRPFATPDTQAMALVFVMQDCPIANAYIPVINQLDEEFRGQGIVMFVVQTDPELSLEAAQQHAKEYQLKVPVVLDHDHVWVQRAHATRTPEAVLFSPAGELLYRGRIDDRYAALGKRRPQATVHDLREALLAVVAGRPIANPETEAVGCYIPKLSAGD